MSDKDGDYCGVCGGISLGKVTTRKIEIGGTEIGINKLDDIIAEVRALGLGDEGAIAEALLRAARKHNYVPTKRSAEYGEALLRAYRGR